MSYSSHNTTKGSHTILMFSVETDRNSLSMKRKFPGQALTQILHPQLSSLVSLLVYVLFVEDFISQMTQRRASATVAAFLLFCLLLHRENVWAATFTVGDGRGWTFNVEGWPRGKTFKSGDVLGLYLHPVEK